VPEIEETLLPGVGVRHELTTSAGERLSVLTHHSGRRELAIYDRRDPDACIGVLHLSEGDTRALVDVLGGSQISETVTAVQQQVEGLAIEWVRVAAGSPSAGATIADGQLRTRTGASVVAVVRGESTVPAPEPGFRFEAGDVVVAVGTPAGLAELRTILAA
jgi:TrkA domain protein